MVVVVFYAYCSGSIACDTVTRPTFGGLSARPKFNRGVLGASCRMFKAFDRNFKGVLSAFKMPFKVFRGLFKIC